MKQINLKEDLIGGKYGSLKVHLDTWTIKLGCRPKRAHRNCPCIYRKKIIAQQVRPERNEADSNGCKRRPEGIDAHKEDAVIADNRLDAEQHCDNPSVHAGVRWKNTMGVCDAFVQVDGETKKHRYYPPDELDRALAYKGELEEWAQKKYPCEGDTAGILMSAAQTAQMP